LQNGATATVTRVAPRDLRLFRLKRAPSIVIQRLPKSRLQTKQKFFEAFFLRVFAPFALISFLAFFAASLLCDSKILILDLKKTPIFFRRRALARQPAQEDNDLLSYEFLPRALIDF